MYPKKQTLLFLSKNHYPFTHFSTKMLKHAGDALRNLEIKGGESFTLQATSAEDYLYVINGSVIIKQNESDDLRIDASDLDAQPIIFDEAVTLRTDSNTIICHADSALLNDYMSLQALSDSSVTEDAEALTERLMFLKSTPVFRLLPVSVIEEAAKRCEELSVKQGEKIIRQNVRADDFYVLLEGEAEVWQENIDDDNPKMVALLTSGDSFGKEALIIGGGHKSSITMSTSGRLLKITKADFDELVSTPALRSVSPKVAQAMVDSGAKIIDVRYEEEYEKESIPGSVLFPLPDLRQHIPSFDESTQYLVLCAVGLRAAAATMMLRQQNINAFYIEGGIKTWPFKTDKKREIELILFDFCPFAQRAVATLNHTGIPHKLTYLDPDNLPDWFAEVSPFGKVPILRVDGKTTIFESSVINELVARIAEKKMLPSDLIEMSLCRSWIEFGSTLLSQLTGIISAQDEFGFVQTQKNFVQNLQRLEEHLEKHGLFCSADDFSLVDSTYAPLFMRMKYLNNIMNLYHRLDFPNIEMWSERLLSLSAVIDSVPSNFSNIYQRFIQRKGAEGYLASTMKKAA